MIKVKKPQVELAILLERLYNLDLTNCGPKWLYITREKSKYMLQRAKLVREILEVDDTIKVPNKEECEKFYFY